MAALIAAGYTVFPVNPLQASRYPRPGMACRELEERRRWTRTCWPTRCAPMRTSCAGRPGTARQAGAVKVLARTHKTLIWERTAVTQRLRAQLLEYFPAAVAAFEDLDAPDTLELLASAPDPGQELVKSSV